jgi:hypothetical protein
MKTMAIAILLMGANNISLAQNKPIGTLRLYLVNVWGDPVADCRVKSLTDESGHSLSIPANVETVKVPYGDYEARVDDCPQYFPVNKSVAVRAPRVSYMIGLKFTGIDAVSPNGSLSGSIKGSVGSDSWCKASGVFTGDEFFSAVSPRSSFHFVALPVGLYSIVCRLSDGSFLSGTAKVTTAPNNTIELGR